MLWRLKSLASPRLFTQPFIQAQIKENITAPRHLRLWPLNSPHKWPVKRKMFPFDDVIMFLLPIGLLCVQFGNTFYGIVYLCFRISVTESNAFCVLAHTRFRYMPRMSMYCCDNHSWEIIWNDMWVAWRGYTYDTDALLLLEALFQEIVPKNENISPKLKFISNHTKLVFLSINFQGV